MKDDLQGGLVVKLDDNSLSIALFVIFHSMPFFIWALENTLDFVSLSYLARPILLALIYTLGVIQYVKTNNTFGDFFLLWFVVVLYFLATYLVHPEYDYVYTRSYYGVWPYVLRPDNGLYVYFFIRLINDPDRLYKGLRISALITLFYSLLTLFFALRRGYWYEQDSLGHVLKSSYGLNFGYNLVLPICTFFFGWTKGKRGFDLFLSIIGIVMILLGGSRGPFIAIMIFFVLLMLMRIKESNHKYCIVLSLCVFCGLLFNHKLIIQIIGRALQGFNLTSRTIDNMIEGTIFDDNGRYEIWQGAINMIKENIFGYGAMGARNTLYQIHYVGHPHNVFLELLIDYGVIIGSVLILAIGIVSFRIMFSETYRNWRWIYLLFFIQACTLLTSYTYWHSTGIWGILAVAVCVHKSTLINSTGRKKQWDIVEQKTL